MAHNPIQIVLNSGNFVDDQQINPGGSKTDFYAERDEQFAVHKADLISQFAATKASIASSGRSAGFARVELRTAALAKSHRPTQILLKADATPIQGVSDFGELLVELTPAAVDTVINNVSKAEPETRRKLDRNGKLKPNPSRLRSEVGAVAKVTPYGPSDRRDFSLDAAASWLSDPRSGGYLLIQMFIPVTQKDHASDDRQAREMVVFQRRLLEVHPSLLLTEASDWWSERGFLRLGMDSQGASRSSEVLRDVIAVLDSEPYVRKVWLPPIIEQTRVVTSPSESNGAPYFVPPRTDANYPIIGIVDTGVSDIDALAPWVVGRVVAGDPESRDTSHGTFIGGLVADAGFLNTQPEVAESACRIFDLGLHITDEQSWAEAYPNGFMDFLEQLDFEVEEASKSGVRVFNMSLVLNELVRNDTYSPFAARLDDIADKHDVVFVVSAGNLSEPLFRSPWPLKADQALEMLANYPYPGADRLHQPADSIRSIVVGALDPRRDTSVQLVPSIYTRRGPGLAMGSKPDLCHLGGAADSTNQLQSFDATGLVVSGCGTSYAAPFVAKTLGHIEHKISGAVKRETLTALAVHGAVAPLHMEHAKLAHVARDFVGFGIPQTSDQILLTDDHSITLVFESQLKTKKALTFDFQWPQALVRQGGKCAGAATLTLVYRPPLDMKYGSETVRVNLEAYLRQEKLDIDTGELSYEGFFKSRGSSGLERERVREGQKWGSVKKWSRKTQKAGVGTSSQFRLVIEPLSRSGFAIPEEGIPFAAILSITDPWGEAPVFNQMRRSLQARDVTIADIRTAAQIRPRVGE